MSDFTDRMQAELSQETGGRTEGAGGGDFFDPLDAALAIPRGLADAARNVYDLGDKVLFDALPDWAPHPLGESTSMVGGFLEGATDFAAGFIPVFGQLSKVGYFAKAQTLGKIAQGALASGIAGATVMDGHEARLSNLLQQSDSLSGPITAFLASEKDDSFFEGRVKSALENAALGAVGDSLIAAFKGIKAARAVRAAGGSDEAAARAGAQAATDAGLTPAILRGEDPLSPVAPAELVGAADEAASTVAQAAASAVDQTTPEDLAKGMGINNPANPDMAGVAEMRGPSGMVEDLTGKRKVLLRQLGLPADKIDEFITTWDQRLDLTFPAKQVKGLETTAVNPRSLSPGERMQLLLRRSDPNISFFTGQEGAAELLRTVDELFGSAIREDMGLTPMTRPQMVERANSVLAQIAKDTGADPSSPYFQSALLRRGGELLTKEDEILSHVMATQTVLQMKAEQLFTLLTKRATTAVGTPESQLLTVRMRQSLQDVTDLHAVVRGFRNKWGRTGQAMQQRNATLPLDMWDMDELSKLASEGMTEADAVMVAKKALAAANGDARIAHSIARAPLLTRFGRATQEYWMNALLSGLRTANVNILGPTINSVYRPIERMLGAKLTEGAAVLKGDAQQALAANKTFKQALSQMSALKDSVAESFSSAKSMGLSGENVLDQRVGVHDPGTPKRAISAAAFNLSTASAMGRMVDFMGTVVNTPTAILASGDEFTKNLNYRSYARGFFEREALDSGITGDAVKQHVANQLEKFVYKNQLYTIQTLFQRGFDEAKLANPNATRPELVDLAGRYVKARWESEGKALSALSKEAIEYARDVTFTTPAQPGTVSHGLQRFVYQHPMMRFVLPFINTPMNLIKWTGQRVDFVSAARLAASRVFPESELVGAKALEATKSRFILDMNSGDPKRIADATGRLATGAGVVTYMYHKAAAGEITGRGPKDPEQRRMLLDAGWLPYSFKFGDKYISYARLDPLASMIGTVADIADYARYAHVDEQDKMETMAWGVAYAAANNFTNKTYLAGVAMWVDAMEDPQRNLAGFMQRFASSFVPSIAGQAVLPAGDEDMRDVRSILDAIVNRTPGLSDTLPPQRNVLGEPVKRLKAVGTDAINEWLDWFVPIQATEVSDDLIKQEMVSLRHAFTTPKPEVNGLNLSGVKMPGSEQTVYDRWSELHGEVKVGGMTIRDAMRKVIKSKDYQKLSDVTTSDFESPRVQRLNEVIREYRSAAWAQLLKESPEIKAHMRDYNTTKRLLRAGHDPRIIPGGI